MKQNKTMEEKIMADILQQADEIRAGAGRAKETLEETRMQLKKKAENAWEDTIELVKRHPGKALGIALGAGFALGSLVLALSREESTTSRLKGLAGTGMDAWEKVTKGFTEAVVSLKNAAEDAATKFK
jgi:ElaB/YqjD/DUF883 family membrane-anchored ribosome-binding protein